MNHRKKKSLCSKFFQWLKFYLSFIKFHQVFWFLSSFMLSKIWFFELTDLERCAYILKREDLTLLGGLNRVAFVANKRRDYLSGILVTRSQKKKKKAITDIFFSPNDTFYDIHKFTEYSWHYVLFLKVAELFSEVFNAGLVCASIR